MKTGLRYAALAAFAILAAGSMTPAFADNTKQDVVVATTSPNPVRADPAPKPDPVGQKISDHKPQIKIKPAAPPPPPPTK